MTYKRRPAGPAGDIGRPKSRRDIIAAYFAKRGMGPKRPPYRKS